MHTMVLVKSHYKKYCHPLPFTFAILCSSNHLPVHDLVSAATFGIGDDQNDNVPIGVIH